MDTLQTSDEELVRAVQSGDVSAFEILVRRYSARLVRVARRIITDPHLAEDIVQESFVRVYQTMDSVDTGKKFSSYLYSVVRNNAISAWRARKKEDNLDGLADQPDTTDIISEYILSEEQSRVRSALRRLPPAYLQVLTMYYFEDIPYEGIAHKLKIPLNTVRTHLKRGKEKLRALL